MQADWGRGIIRKNPLCQLALAHIIITHTVQTIANLCNKIVLVKNSSALLFVVMQHEAATVKIANTSILLASAIKEAAARLATCTEIWYGMTTLLVRKCVYSI